MKWLSTIGQAIIKGATLVARFEGLIPSTVGGVNIGKIEDTIAKLANIIVDVEVIGQTLALAGPDKLKAAGPLVAQAIIDSSVMVNHEVNDKILFSKGCASIASGFADVLNSLKSK